jgi:hypothetical protein
MLKSKRKAEVAQLVEQPIRNRQVPGSSPGLGSIAILSDQLNILGLQGMGAGRAVNVI